MNRKISEALEWLTFVVGLAFFAWFLGASFVLLLTGEPAMGSIGVAISLCWAVALSLEFKDIGLAEVQDGQ